MHVAIRSTALFVFLCSALHVATAQPDSAFLFRFTEKPGPYGVGLKVVEQYDRSRSFQVESDLPNGPAVAGGPRPLQTLVWYPAERSSERVMTFGDYGALIRTETRFNQPVDHGKPQSFVQTYMRGTTEQNAWAIRDAPMTGGRFPVVIYAPSVNAPATENIELCEFLASEGFVVMASPSMGATSRSMTVDIPGANAEAQDISFLIDFAVTLPDTDASEVAVAGYSWGGMAALSAAARDKRVNALISLDSSFVTAGDIHPDQMKIPLLVFGRGDDTLEYSDSQRNDKTPCDCAPNALNEWTHGDLLHVQLLAISHIQFSSLYQKSERFRKEAMQFSPADYSLEEGAVSYNWMARYTLEFLNAYLKHDESAVLFLKRTPAENGVPRHLMAVNFRRALATPEQVNTPTKK
jgi:pimeloyl-ACP methyl ester carboxylesterase